MGQEPVRSPRPRTCGQISSSMRRRLLHLHLRRHLLLRPRSAPASLRARQAHRRPSPSSRGRPARPEWVTAPACSDCKPWAPRTASRCTWWTEILPTRNRSPATGMASTAASPRSPTASPAPSRRPTGHLEQRLRQSRRRLRQQRPDVEWNPRLRRRSPGRNRAGRQLQPLRPAAAPAGVHGGPIGVLVLGTRSGRARPGLRSRRRCAEPLADHHRRRDGRNHHCPVVRRKRQCPHRRVHPAHRLRSRLQHLVRGIPPGGRRARGAAHGPAERCQRPSLPHRPVAGHGGGGSSDARWTRRSG